MFLIYLVIMSSMAVFVSLQFLLELFSNGQKHDHGDVGAGGGFLR